MFYDEKVPRLPVAFSIVLQGCQALESGTAWRLIVCRVTASRTQRAQSGGGSG